MSAEHTRFDVSFVSTEEIPPITRAESTQILGAVYAVSFVDPDVIAAQAVIGRFSYHKTMIHFASGLESTNIPLPPEIDYETLHCVSYTPGKNTGQLPGVMTIARGLRTETEVPIHLDARRLTALSAGLWHATLLAYRGQLAQEKTSSFTVDPSMIDALSARPAPYVDIYTENVSW